VALSGHLTTTTDRRLCPQVLRVGWASVIYIYRVAVSGLHACVLVVRARRVDRALCFAPPEGLEPSYELSCKSSRWEIVFNNLSATPELNWLADLIRIRSSTGASWRGFFLQPEERPVVLYNLRTDFESNRFSGFSIKHTPLDLGFAHCANYYI